MRARDSCVLSRQAPEEEFDRMLIQYHRYKDLFRVAPNGPFQEHSPYIVLAALAPNPLEE